MLDQAEVQRLLDYDPNTGDFMCLVRRGKMVPGMKAGTINSVGYVILCIHKRLYCAHRVAWLYVHGCWPAAEIDHINGVRTDNRLRNLREASKRQNGQNRGAQKNNTSGHKGVMRDIKPGKWIAVIFVNGRRERLGTFDDIASAAAAYREAEIKYFGEFARAA